MVHWSDGPDDNMLILNNHELLAQHRILVKGEKKLLKSDSCANVEYLTLLWNPFIILLGRIIRVVFFTMSSCFRDGQHYITAFCGVVIHLVT